MEVRRVPVMRAQFRRWLGTCNVAQASEEKLVRVVRQIMQCAALVFRVHYAPT